MLLSVSAWTIMPPTAISVSDPHLLLCGSESLLFSIRHGLWNICSVYTSSSRIKFFLLPGLPTEVCLPGHPADREGSVQARVRQVLPAVPRPHLAAGTDLNNFQHPLLGKIRVCQSVQLWPPPHLVNPERSFWRSVCLGSSTREGGPV